MRKRIHKRTLSLLLAFALLVSIVPTVPSADAAETDTARNDTVSTEELSTEVVTLDEAAVPDIIGVADARERNHVRRRYDEEGDNLNTVVFQNADGSRTLYLYDFPVKYMDENGDIQDISLDIADIPGGKGGFRSEGSHAVTTFSPELDGGIILADSDRALRLVPERPLQTQRFDMTADYSARRVDEKTVEYTYDEYTTLEYSLTYTGFKEDIVVSQYTGQTEYTFTLYTNGLTLTQIDGSYFLTDEAGEIQATIGDIIVFTADERNNTFGQLLSTTIVENEEYLLTIVLDADYLSDPQTVYPIRIDPTIDLNYDNYGSDAIEDVTINSNAGSMGSSGSIFVGLRETKGIARTLMRFPDLPVSNLKGATVTSATVEIRDLMCESTSMPLYCYPYTGTAWTEDSTWSDLTQNWGNALSSNTIKYSNGAALSPIHRYSFDISVAVQGWIDGNYTQSKGIIFKTSSSVESGSTYNYRTFASFNRASYKPSLTVDYTLDATQELSNTTYYLNSKQSGKYLQYTSSAIVGKSGLLSSLGTSIRWQLQKVSEGYVIRLASDTTKYLGVAQSGTGVQYVTVSDATLPDRCIWTITSLSNGCYSIKNLFNSGYLVSSGTSIYTSTTLGTAGTSTYNTRCWRLAKTSVYGNAASYSTRELTVNTSFGNIEVPLEGSAIISIDHCYANEIWADLDDFTYSISDSTIALRSNFTITGENYGGTIITATHKVTDLVFKFYVIVGFSSTITETPIPSSITDAINEPHNVWPATSNSKFYGFTEIERFELLNEIRSRAVITKLGGSVLAYNNAVSMLNHFLNNTGELYTLNMTDLMSDWNTAILNRNEHLNYLLQAAESSATYSNKTLRTIEAIEYPQNDGGDWGNAIGKYSVSLACTYKKVTDSMYEMTVVYELHDAYNWDPEITSMGNIPVSPADMWELHHGGFGRNYEVYGEITYSFSWTVGERIGTEVEVD